MESVQLARAGELAVPVISVGALTCDPSAMSMTAVGWVVPAGGAERTSWPVTFDQRR